MSAHCENCGTDMVYGHGEDWQLMTCPVCDLRADLAAARAREQRLADALTEVAALCTPEKHVPYIDRVAAIRRAARAALEQLEELDAA